MSVCDSGGGSARSGAPCDPQPLQDIGALTLHAAALPPSPPSSCPRTGARTGAPTRACR